jgi:ribosomal protein S18 acetylase RimI-like enzyme
VADDRITVEFVPGWTTWPLRQEVLRPGRPVRDCLFPGEDGPRAASAAALRLVTVADPSGRSPGSAERQVLAVGTVVPEAPSWDPGEPDGWRIRGMATAPAERGQGLGSQVLELLLRHVADRGGGLAWCNARTPARHLYQRAGFEGRGEIFELPEIGPHLVMWRTVAARTGGPVPGDGPSP